MQKEHEIFAAERSVAYSDAIFSIAITLLILEIKIPSLTLAGETELSGATFCVARFST